jgi:hypothetical protein
MPRFCCLCQVERLRMKACPHLMPALRSHPVNGSNANFMIVPSQTDPSFLISLHAEVTAA